MNSPVVDGILVGLVVFLLMMLPVTSANAEDAKEYQPSSSNKYDRVVEFTPKGAPHMLCVAYMSGGRPTLQCFPREEK